MNIFAVVWHCDTHNICVQGDIFRALGYAYDHTPKNIQSLIEFFHPEDKERAQTFHECILQHVENIDFWEQQYRIRSHSGEFISFVAAYTVVLRDANHAPLYISINFVSQKNCTQEIVPIAQRVQAGVANEFPLLSTINNDFFETSFCIGQSLDACKKQCILLGIADDGLWHWDFKQDYISYSSNYGCSFGYNKDTLPQNSIAFYSIIHPDDVKRVKEYQSQRLRSDAFGDIIENTYRIRTSGGEYKWIMARAKVLARDDTGQALNVLGLFIDVSDLHSMQEALVQASHYDSLTKVCNRFYFDKRVSETQANDYPISIICVDIDGLKLTNDNLGHAVGDALLVNVANLLQSNLPKDALIGRVGGDEFTVLLCNCKEEEAVAMVKGIYAAMEKRNSAHKDPVYFALGTATTATPQPVHKLIVKADKRMLAAKKKNRTKHRGAICDWISAQTGLPVDQMDRRISLPADE